MKSNAAIKSRAAYNSHTDSRREAAAGTTAVFRASVGPSVQFSSVHSLSRVRLFATPWTAALQAHIYLLKSPWLWKGSINKYSEGDDRAHCPPPHWSLKVWHFPGEYCFWFILLAWSRFHEFLLFLPIVIALTSQAKKSKCDGAES